MPGSPPPVPEAPGAATFYESARKHQAKLGAFAPSAVLFVLIGGWAAVRLDGLFRYGT